jgi:hypothetical protein
MSNNSLQLHRLAHEELGPSTWSNCDQQIPITTEHDGYLASLDITDPKHPTLQRPAKQEANNTSQTDIPSSSDDQAVSILDDSHAGNGTIVDDVTPALQLEPEIEETSEFSSSVLQISAGGDNTIAESSQQVSQSPTPSAEITHSSTGELDGTRFPPELSPITPTQRQFPNTGAITMTK